MDGLRSQSRELHGGRAFIPPQMAQTILALTRNSSASGIFTRSQQRPRSIQRVSSPAPYAKYAPLPAYS